jgi:hypothetical protein
MVPCSVLLLLLLLLSSSSSSSSVLLLFNHLAASAAYSAGVMAAEKQTKTVYLEGTFTLLSRVDRLWGLLYSWQST